MGSKRLITAINPEVIVSQKDVEYLNCAACEYGYCTFQIPECKHSFHFRCVSEWPVYRCPHCNVPSNGLLVLQTDCPEGRLPLRTGKWITEEVEFMNGMLTEFLEGRLFCANGTSLRHILSRALNCSPMRLSKRFQKNALGKHTFQLPKSRKIILNKEKHLEQQQKLSKLEDEFYTALGTSKKKGSEKELQNLRNAVQQFWCSQLLEFAKHLRQPVVGYGFHITTKKRRKSSSTSVTPVIRTTNGLSKYGFPDMPNSTDALTKRLVYDSSNLTKDPIFLVEELEMLDKNYQSIPEFETQSDSLEPTSETQIKDANSCNQFSLGYDKLNQNYDVLNLDLQLLPSVDTIEDFKFEKSNFGELKTCSKLNEDHMALGMDLENWLDMKDLSFDCNLFNTMPFFGNSVSPIC